MSATVRAYLSLGSNLGDRLANLANAVARLDTRDEIVVAAVSPVYETAPIGESGAVVTDQPSYFNCAIAIDTTLEPAQLRTFTAGIEIAMGRGSHGRWQPRTIDIDLVLYGDEEVSTATVTVPHPRMMERAFVLQPLVDLDPDLSAPRLGRLADALAKIHAQGCEAHTSAADLEALVRKFAVKPSGQ